MCKVPPLVRERLSEPEAFCDECGVRLERGDEIAARIETGEIFCSRRCGQASDRRALEVQRRRKAKRTRTLILLEG